MYPSTGGGLFQIPADYTGFLVEAGSPSVAVGSLTGNTAALPSIGLACDVAGTFIIEEKSPNRNVLVY